MGQSTNPKGFRPARGGNAKVTMMEVAATETFATGDALILSTGQVAIATAASAAIIGVAAGPCASLAQATLVPVWSDPGEVFIGRCEDASALLTGAVADIVGATGAMMIDVDTATNVVMIVRQHDADESTGSAGAEYEFTWALHLLAEQSGV